MHPIFKDPRLCGLFQYTKEVVIEFGHYVHVHVHVVYVSVIFCYCTDGFSGVVLSFMYPIFKDLQLWGLFQYTKEVEFLHWTRYVHVVYVSVIVSYCTDGHDPKMDENCR